MKIDVNIPVPTRVSWRTVLGNLHVDESLSFDAPCRASVSNAISAHYHKLTEKRFTVSADPFDKNKLRVWRLK
ncbi:hypothetical protein [Mucilaginibacter paludis]|uniref:Uncharacterized protein n=1 Tax=Mucilaginibacter paludis DSM 18603 TaxID=714943 RepID=H1YH59_9SPHI|nr:hypothetical protein [Mucilaginibacter paludis]EHQ24561.1 hypothetical protein Mucpa_0365 [Mucilaginibacter paludis DSM 18603]